MYLPHASVSSILAAVTKLKPVAGQALMVLVAEKNAPNLKSLQRALKETQVPFFGGLFPAVIAHARIHSEGAILATLPVWAAPRLFTGLERADLTLPDLELNPESDTTVIVLTDGLAAGIASFLGSLFGQLGLSAHYLGGGAGTSALEPRPCIFSAEGVFQNAAVLAFVRWHGSLGVQHGLKRLDGPLVATRARQNVLQELNWRPAFEVYRDIVEHDSGRKVTADRFYIAGHSWAYPFGLVREGAEDVVREPLAVEPDGGIRCGGGIPENAVLHIMKGNPPDLIAAAGRAASAAVECTPRPPYYVMVCDCISRHLFLGHRIAEELETVAREVRRTGAGVNPEGILTLGEISSSGESLLDFFNKTIVVGILSDG